MRFAFHASSGVRLTAGSSASSPEVPSVLPKAWALARDVLQFDQVRSKAADAVPDSAANHVRARRDALRREMLALDRNALAKAARADLVGPAWQERPMTLTDAARLVSRDFVIAADRAAQLLDKATDVQTAVQHYEGVLCSSQDQGDKRWREMGLLRQAGGSDDWEWPAAEVAGDVRLAANRLERADPDGDRDARPGQYDTGDGTARRGAGGGRDGRLARPRAPNAAATRRPG